ncbi:unnamed protein product [Pedinophyceae sp. YPF-701]|nr:unnamed protein product [Pedinophyceae sp. YPF-701]
MFTGDWKTQSRVSLAGRGGVAETREQLLQRNRLEREQRHRNRREAAAASTIQRHWKAYLAWSNAARELARRWTVDDASCRPSGPSGASELAFACRPDVSTDLAHLISFSCAVLTSAPAAGTPLAICVVGAPQHTTPTHQGARAARLALLLIRSLQHATFRGRPLLAAPLRDVVTAEIDSGDDNTNSAALVKLLLSLLSADTWRAALGPDRAPAVCAALSAGLRDGPWRIRSLCRLGAAAEELRGAVTAAAPPDGLLAGALKGTVGEAVLLHTLSRSYPQGVVLGTPPQSDAMDVDGGGSRTQGAPGTRTRTILRLMSAPGVVAAAPALRAMPSLLQRLLPATLAALHSYAVASATEAVEIAANLSRCVEYLAAADRRADEPSSALQLLAAPFCQTLSGLLESGLPSDSAATSARAGALDHAAAAAWQRALAAVVNGTVLPWLVAAAARPADTAGAAADPAPVQAMCALVLQILAAPALREPALRELAFHPGFLPRLWTHHLRHIQSDATYAAACGAGEPCVARRDPGWMLPLAAFAPALALNMQVLGTSEMYTHQRPLRLAELYEAGRGGAAVGLVPLLREALMHVLWREAPTTVSSLPPPAAEVRAAVRDGCGGLLWQLYLRNLRQPFAPATAFHAPEVSGDGFAREAEAAAVAVEAASGPAVDDASSSDDDDDDDASAMPLGATAGHRRRMRPVAGSGDDRGRGGRSRAWQLLKHAPYLVPFVDRARVFQAVVASDRSRPRARQPEALPLVPGDLGGSRSFLRIRRGHVVEDGYAAMNALGDALKSRVRVQFFDQFGAAEAGVDGGGLFKDFLEELVKEAFDPQAGLFTSNANQELYPSPDSADNVPDGDDLRLLEFVGRMVGKAVHDGILLELPLAPFFLKKLTRVACDVDDLDSLDPELSKNLAFLRTWVAEGKDVADLSLTFAVEGRRGLVPLRPGGATVSVGNGNVMQYIHLVAHYKLNRQIAPQCAAFIRGFNQLIKPQWIRVFAPEEIQTLIGGSLEAIDLADMRAHVEYHSGYANGHPVIERFWRVVAAMTPQDQAALLRFVTSCSRPPLLGFSQLEPKIGIAMAGGVRDKASHKRLPTAATCMNLLKLPPYQSDQVMRDKLLYAINSGAGFDLS